MSYELWTQIGETVSQLVAFLIFVWILKRYAWGPVSSVIDQRQQDIEDGFAKIEARQAEAEKLHKEYDVRLSNIEKEAREKIQEAIAEGRRVASEIEERARQQAMAIREQAQRNIEIEIAKARVALRDEIVTMTIDASEHLMRRRLDEAEDRRLVGAFIDELEGKMR